MAVPELLIRITLKLMYFLIPEFLVLLLIAKKGNQFSFRFGRNKSFAGSGLWIIAVVILIVAVFSQDIFEAIFGSTLHKWLAGFGIKMICLTISLAGLSFLWAYNYLMERYWDVISWIVSLLSALLLVLFFVH